MMTIRDGPPKGIMLRRSGQKESCFPFDGFQCVTFVPNSFRIVGVITMESEGPITFMEGFDTLDPYRGIDALA